MGRNGYDAQCLECGTNFVVIIGNAIKCPECGFVATASPEPIRINREREGVKGSSELAPNLPKAADKVA